MPTATTKTIRDVENRPITFHIHRIVSEEKVPLLVVIDGSGCGGQLRVGIGSLYLPGAPDSQAFARLAVEKPGVEPLAESGADCSTEFRERFSLDQWVVDHLRVLQHLKARADWWDGRLLIFGWSDGGDVGARLMSYYPNTARAVLGGMGGGYTMAQHITEFWDCAADRTENREVCLDEISDWFDDVRAKPLASLGKRDSNLLWRSRLFADLGTILADTTAPLLIVHGSQDRDQTPVESARLLVLRLRREGRADISYCEVREMAHGVGSLRPKDAFDLENAMHDFLFDPAAWSESQLKLCDPNPRLASHLPPKD